ncbi:RNA polymerase sigma-70 factor, partial [Parabacteroides sp. OttesenSCG-928-K15]|nr:RNA polymerase sigma-70 factor [Parabacteroides sp. OttesenSCG-928-K15]
MMHTGQNMSFLFKQLFDHYFEQLVLYAFRFLNDWQAAEDMVQEVFLSLWINRSDVDFTEPMKPYLYKATYNKAMNYITSFSVQKRVNPATTDELINQVIMKFNQYDNLLAKEIMHEITSCFETLPPQCQKVFMLSRQEGMKNRKIAELLGISEKTVEKHISKALSGIRQHLADLDLLSVAITACL